MTSGPPVGPDPPDQRILIDQDEPVGPFGRSGRSERDETAGQDDTADPARDGTAGPDDTAGQDDTADPAPDDTADPAPDDTADPARDGPPGDDLDGRPPIDPRIRERRLAILRSQGRRRLLWLGGATAALVLVVLVLALAHTPWFGARAVSVTGTHPHTPDSAILDAAGLQHHPPLISVNPGVVARRVESLPFIASARVRRHWPDGVQIAVTERVPVVQMAGPGTSWSLLDGYGRTLQVVPGRQPGLVAFAVHTATTGIPPATVGRSLPPSAGPGLAISRTLPPAFSGQVVSVTVAADGTISLALNSGVTVLVGSDADRTAKYKDIAAILANGTLHTTSTIDVSVPESPTVSG